MGDFADEINKFTRTYEARLRATARTAVQDTLSMAQRTVGQGGRMRVDTGFLRASLQASLDGLPSGPIDNDGGYGGKKKYPEGSQVAGEPVAVTLLKWDPTKGMPVFAGWTAKYARYREAKDGFLKGALEKWDQTVTKVATAIKATGID